MKAIKLVIILISIPLSVWGQEDQKAWESLQKNKACFEEYFDFALHFPDSEYFDSACWFMEEYLNTVNLSQLIINSNEKKLSYTLFTDEFEYGHSDYTKLTVLHISPNTIGINSCAYLANEFKTELAKAFEYNAKMPNKLNRISQSSTPLYKLVDSNVEIMFQTFLKDGFVQIKRNNEFWYKLVGVFNVIMSQKKRFGKSFYARIYFDNWMPTRLPVPSSSFLEIERDPLNKLINKLDKESILEEKDF